MNTFRADGYTDATQGFPPSPPGSYTNSKGSTDVFACEYLEGYAAGKAAVQATQ